MAAAGRNVVRAMDPIPKQTRYVEKGDHVWLWCSNTDGQQDGKVHFVHDQDLGTSACHDENDLYPNGLLVRNASFDTAGEYSCYKGTCCDGNDRTDLIKKYEVVIGCESVFFYYY